jgi:hypothetical protein
MVKRYRVGQGTASLSSDKVWGKIWDDIPALLNQLLAITPSAARPSSKSWENSFISRDAGAGFRERSDETSMQSKY